MSALTVLFLVLPLPVACILHIAEIALVQHRWFPAHSDTMTRKFARFQPAVSLWVTRGGRIFAITAFVELAAILAATTYVLAQGTHVTEVWSVFFMAFSFHLLSHFVAAAILKCYVPGLATALLLLPYTGYGMYSIWLVMSGMELMMWGAASLLFMAANLWTAYFIVSKMKRR